MGAGYRRNSLMAISGVAYPHGGRPVAIFYPFGDPIPYTYGKSSTSKIYAKLLLVFIFISNCNFVSLHANWFYFLKLSFSLYLKLFFQMKSMVLKNVLDIR
jgi:hypothetical protein